MEINLFYEDSMEFAGSFESQNIFSYEEVFCGEGSWYCSLDLNSITKKFLNGNYLVELDKKRNLFGLLKEKDKETSQTDSSLLLALSFSGPTTQSYVKDRINWGVFFGNNNISELAYELINKHMVNPTNILRKIPNFFIPSEPREVFGEEREMQATGKQLDEVVIPLLEAEGLGYKVNTDVVNKMHTFFVYSGKNRAVNQEENNIVIFSQKLDNITSSKYHRNESNLKNVAWVGGQGEGVDRIWSEVNNEKYSGLQRKELFVDARDISTEYEDSSGEKHVIPLDEYKNLLNGRALEKLSECQIIENFESGIFINGRYQYGVHYFLGDTVTFEDTDLGITLNAMVTKAKTTYNGAEKSVEITFGFDTPSLKSILLRGGS